MVPASLELLTLLSQPQVLVLQELHHHTQLQLSSKGLITSWTHEIAQRVKVLASKPQDLSLLPWGPQGAGQARASQVVLSFHQGPILWFL